MAQKISRSYATWNPSDKSAYISLSGGDLTISSSSAPNYANIRSTLSKTSGKWYWETTYSATFNASNISIKSANYTLTTTTPEIATNSTEEVQTVTTAQTQTNVTYNPKPAENPNYGYINDNRVDIGEGPNANGGGFGGDNGNSDTPGGGGGTAGEG